MTTDQPRRSLGRVLRASFVPNKLFGGRVRTSTLVLCILWVVLYSLYTYFNPAEETVQGILGTVTSVVEAPASPSGG